MRSNLRKAIKSCSTFDEVLETTLKILEKTIQENPSVAIGYVAGKVTADGQANILKNLKRLHKYTRKVTKFHGQFAFSAADIFNNDVYWKLNIATPLHKEDFYKFWRAVVSKGVTDIYMTPKWEKSLGAKDEHSIAKELGIRIHYL